MDTELAALENVIERLRVYRDGGCGNLTPPILLAMSRWENAAWRAGSPDGLPKSAAGFRVRLQTTRIPKERPAIARHLSVAAMERKEELESELQIFIEER